jgi:hypothetical protein
MNKLIITGIPGTGKTTIGNFLQDNFDYKHIDMEDGWLITLIDKPDEFSHQLNNDKVVVTWGFLAREDQTKMVLDIKQNGYKLFWFDGNRDAALREFNIRGDVSEALFHRQIDAINNFGLPDKIDPILLNPFKVDGIFKDRDQIVKEIFDLANSS